MYYHPNPTYPRYRNHVDCVKIGISSVYCQHTGMGRRSDYFARRKSYLGHGVEGVKCGQGPKMWIAAVTESHLLFV